MINLTWMAGPRVPRMATRAGALAALAVVLLLAFQGSAQATHPRPGGASPDRLALVPVFHQCISANSAHAAPLAPYSSCSPPATVSPVLTIGTTGASNGSVRLDVGCSDGATPPCLAQAGDQLDVRVHMTVTDIRCKIGGTIPTCPAAGDDYSGKVLVQLPIRLTDHANGSPAAACATGSGNAPCVTATVQDFNFVIPSGDCATTPASANGSACSVATSLDSAVPGAVKELQRMSYQLGAVSVLDLGFDDMITSGGSNPCPWKCLTGDENAVLTQGFFSP